MKQISSRNAVFLDAMGIGPLWALRDKAQAPEAAPLPVSTLPIPAAAAAVSTPPAPPVSEPAIALMDWAELTAAAAKCTRCDLCHSRKRSVFGRGAKDAEWLVIGSGPSRADEKDGQPVSGAAGALLDNMLLAIGLAPHVYVTNLVKCHPQDGNGVERAPSEEEIAACRPYLERELKLTQGEMIVAIGDQALAGNAGPYQLGSIPVVSTFHPEHLLRHGEDKAKAWADLCLARSMHVRRP